jgi:hypothetical protein
MDLEDYYLLRGKNHGPAESTLRRTLSERPPSRVVKEEKRVGLNDFFQKEEKKEDKTKQKQKRKKSISGRSVQSSRNPSSSSRGEEISLTGFFMKEESSKPRRKKSISNRSTTSAPAHIEAVEPPPPVMTRRKLKGAPIGICAQSSSSPSITGKKSRALSMSVVGSSSSSSSPAMTRRKSSRHTSGLDNSNHSTGSTPIMKLNMTCPTRKKPDRGNLKRDKSRKNFLQDRVSAIIGKEDAMAMLLTHELNHMDW